jgi:hypothetical protein
MSLLAFLLDTKFLIYVMWMGVGHFAADFILPNSWANENRKPGSNVYNSNGTVEPLWGWVLTAHALVHAATVILATGWVVLGIMRFVVVAISKSLKDREIYKYPLATDQCIHLASIVILAAIGVWLDGAVI